MNEIKGYCPKCGRVLYRDAKDATVHCYGCNSEVTPQATPDVDKCVDSAASVAVFPTFDDPGSAQVYVENLLATYDFDEYVSSADIELPKLAKAVEEVKMKSGTVGATWLLDFTSVVIPVTKKLEALSELERRIGERYDPTDLSDAYELFDIYSRIGSALIDARDGLLVRLSSDVEYAERFGLDSKNLEQMKARLTSFTTAIGAIRDYADVTALPAYAAAKAELSEKRRAELSAEGISAEDVYAASVSYYESGEYGYNEAIRGFERIIGYKDSAEYIERINKYFSFHKEFFLFMGKTYIFKKINGSTFNVTGGQNTDSEKSVDASTESESESAGPAYSLFEVIDGASAPHPTIVGITRIVGCYGTRIYYFNRNGCVCSFDLAEEREHRLVEGAPDDYITDGKGYYVRLCRGKNAFVFKKKLKTEEEKPGCLAAFFGHTTTVDVKGNNYSAILVDMSEDTATVAVPEMLDVADFYGDSLFYTYAVDTGKTNADGEKLYKTRLMLCDLSEITNEQILDESCEIHNVCDGRVIYSLWMPNALNRSLHAYGIKDGTDVCIEKNIYAYNSVHKGYVYYTVGNARYLPLVRNNLEGNERKEIMTDIERILFARGEWLYIQRGSGINAALFKIKRDGSRLVWICSQFRYIVRFTENYIYYIDTFDTLHIVRVDGMNDRVIADEIAFNAENPEAYVAFSDDGIYYQRRETVEPGSKKKAFSLYKMDLSGHNVRKIAFNIQKMLDFDKDVLYYSVNERTRYKLTIPKGKKEGSEIRYDYFNIKRYYKLDKSTDTSELILTKGLPHGKSTYQQGCSGKSVTEDIIYEPAPVVHTYKRRGLAGVGAVAASTDEIPTKKGANPLLITSGILLALLMIIGLAAESVALLVIGAVLTAVSILLVSGALRRATTAIPEVHVKHKIGCIAVYVMVLIAFIASAIGMAPRGQSASENRPDYVYVNSGYTYYVYSQNQYYNFTPSITGDYRFVSYGDYDTRISIYRDGYQVGHDDEDGDNQNFDLTVYLEAGNTYQIDLYRYNGSESSMYTFFISDVQNNLTTGSASDPRVMEAGVDYELYMRSGDEYFFAFTPAYSDYYAVFSEGDTDVRVTVYDQFWNEIGSNDDHDGTDFYYSDYYYYGNTYYFKVDLVGATGYTTIRVNK